MRDGLSPALSGWLELVNAEQQRRYARHLALSEVGETGQQRLLAASVLVVGAGGLGAPASLYLAAAGVGRLGIMDGDSVELSNLQRQIVHGEADLGQPKVASACRTLQALNSQVNLVAIPEFFTASHAAAHLPEYDFIIDATDAPASKAQLAQSCYQHGLAYCHAGVEAFHGQLLTVIPGETACYHCVFADDTEALSDLAGPIGPLPGVLGSLQALEAVKYFASLGGLYSNRLLTIDALTGRWREIPVARRAACPVCGTAN